MTATQRRIRSLLVRVGFALGRLTPLRRRVVLATSHADRLTGNLAMILEELGRRVPNVPVTVLARAPRADLRGRVRSVLDAVRAGWLLATSRVFVVDDYFFPMYVIAPRHGTSFVQVWHACGAFKRFGYSLGGRSFGAGEEALRQFSIHRNYDLCLVSAMRFAPFYAEAFRMPVDRFSSRYGIPRTDVFFDSDRIEKVQRRLRAGYGIPSGKRVVLYAPTFRGDETTSARSPNDLDLAELRSRIGTDHVVLLRAHPFVADHARVEPELGGFVIDVSGEPEINDLMVVSDVLVTDYSSAMYEFALLERPIAFFAPDHERYERERGFYLDYARDLPGPVFETTAALGDWLDGGVPDLHRIRAFRASSFDVADGRSTSRFVDEVILPRLG